MKKPNAEQFLFAANVLADMVLFRQDVGKDVKSILVVKWDEIGDMATATHVFSLLKKQYPQAYLTLLCKPFVRDLVSSDPNIDVIVTSVDYFNKRYEMVVELRGTWKTLWRSIRHKAKYRVSRAGVRLRNKGRQLHEVTTNFEVVKPLLAPGTVNEAPRLYYSERDRVKVEDFLASNHIGKYAIIHVGARRKLRQWNLDRFALVAQYLRERYGMDIIFAGSAEDNSDIAQVQALLPFASYRFTEGYSLSQFSCLCSKASFYLGNESGPMHIASAFEVPLLGLFGPGVPVVFYPRSPRSAVLHHVLSCNPCDQIHCVHPGNPCISRILVADVLVKVDEILQ